MVLSLLLQETSSAPYFFGYMGAAFALVFASAFLVAALSASFFCPPLTATCRRATQLMAVVGRGRGAEGGGGRGALRVRPGPPVRLSRRERVEACSLVPPQPLSPNANGGVPGSAGEPGGRSLS